MAPEQGGTEVPSAESVPEPGPIIGVRCAACGAGAQFDPAAGYGRRRLDEGHLACGAAWEPTP